VPGIADPPRAVSASMAQRDADPVAGSGGAERAGGAQELEAPPKLLPAGTGPDAGDELDAGTTLEIGNALETGGFEESPAAGGFEDVKPTSD